MLSSLINRMIILRRLAPTGNKDLKENKDGTHRNNGKKMAQVLAQVIIILKML